MPPPGVFQIPLSDCTTIGLYSTPKEACLPESRFPSR